MPMCSLWDLKKRHKELRIKGEITIKGNPFSTIIPRKSIEWDSFEWKLLKLQAKDIANVAVNRRKQ